MSHMEICRCTLKGYDRNLMIQAINLVKEKLGGNGLLKVSKVRGYGHRKVPADLIFRFKGMNFPMGIRINDDHVEFVGDAWKSENWEITCQSASIPIERTCGM